MCNGPVAHRLIYSQAGGVAQVVQCLPSKCEALSSNPSHHKERELMPQDFQQYLTINANKCYHSDL
jgi:hypothetical protein